jgi:hypothetical protein
MTDTEHTIYILYTLLGVMKFTTKQGFVDVEKDEIGIAISRRRVTISLNPTSSKSVTISPDGTRFTFSVEGPKVQETSPESGFTNKE